VRINDDCSAGNRFGSGQRPDDLLVRQLGDHQRGNDDGFNGERSKSGDGPCQQQPVQQPGQANIPAHFAIHEPESGVHDNDTESGHQQPAPGAVEPPDQQPGQ